MFPLWTAAASFVPSLEDVIARHSLLLALEVQETPEFKEIQIFPQTVAASLVPSLEDVMSLHSATLALEVQETPEFEEIQIPLGLVAASLVPSLEEVMPLQSCEEPRSYQLSPESVDVQMNPVLTVAASLVPSLEEAMLVHSLVLNDVCSTQFAPESVEVQMCPPLTVAASLVPSSEDAIPHHGSPYSTPRPLVPATAPIRLCSVKFNLYEEVSAQSNPPGPQSATRGSARIASQGSPSLSCPLAARRGSSGNDDQGVLGGGGA